VGIRAESNQRRPDRRNLSAGTMSVGTMPLAKLGFVGGILMVVLGIAGATTVAAPNAPASPSASKATAAPAPAPRPRRFVQPVRPGQQNFISRAIFAEGRLWLLTDAGQLSSIAEGAETRVEENLPEPALDLCLNEGAPTVVTCDGGECSHWSVRLWDKGRWSVAAAVPSAGDRLLAMSCLKGDVVLVTQRRVVAVSGNRTEAVTLGEGLRGGMVTSVDVEKDQVYVGVDAGEWGGGLQRIDRRTGKVTVVERNASGELCGGPLNSDCDPVNGIAVEPWRPDCVAAVVGLVHFSPHGRIVEICGDEVKRIYFKSYGSGSPMTHRERGDEPGDTVAFFGLVRSGDELWASGIDGLYRLRGGRVVDVTPLPRFKAIGGVGVSFDIPHVVLVVTMINRRHSISGGAPMLVPR